MQQSESVNELASALCKAQAAMDPVAKSASGYGYKYAPLDAVIDMVRPVLSAHGLAFVQFPGAGSPDMVTLTTRLMHESGQWLEETMALPVPEVGKSNDAQAYGAALTYARRYALTAMLGISTDEDVDAAPRQGQPQRQPAPRKAAKETPANGSGDKPFYTAVVKETPWFGDEQAVEDTMVLLGLGYPSRADEARSHRALLAQYAQLVADGKTQAEAVATLTVPKAA